MPILNDIRNTRTVVLPSFKDSKIEIYDGLLFGNYIEISKDLKEGSSDFEKGLKIIVKTIKSWNFTDEEENELPVTEENLMKLPDKDISFLNEQINVVEEKKTDIEKKN